MSLRSGHQFEQYLLDLYPIPQTDSLTIKQLVPQKQINQMNPTSKITEKYIHQNIKTYGNSSNKILQKDINNHQNNQKRPAKKYSGNKFNFLEPWSQNDFQIVQYHKKQQMEQQKIKKFSKNALKSQQSNITNRSRTRIHNQSERSTKQGFFNNSNQKNFLRLSKKIQKQKTYTSRTQYQKDDKFNTVITSTQQKLKWHLQMQVMVKRRKKLTNLLKLRHFGYLKSNNIKNQNERTKNTKQNMSLQHQDLQQNSQYYSDKYKQYLTQPKKEKENQNSQIKLQNYSQNFQDSFIYTRVRFKQALNQENKEQKQKEVKCKQKDQKTKKFSFSQHKKQTNMQIQHLYSALRSYTQKNRANQKGSFTLSSKNRSLDGTLTQFQKSPKLSIQLMKNKDINNSGEKFQIQKNNHLVKNSVPFKKRISSLLMHSDQKKIVSNNCFEWKSKEKKYPHSSTSLSFQLNKTCYTGHSIKNKLKLLQSNLSKNRDKYKERKKKLEVEYIEEASCFQKKQRQIKIKNFNI